MEFDPLKLKKRIEDNEACTSMSVWDWSIANDSVNKVAWYM